MSRAGCRRDFLPLSKTARSSRAGDASGLDSPGPDSISAAIRKDALESSSKARETARRVLKKGKPHLSSLKSLVRDE